MAKIAIVLLVAVAAVLSASSVSANRLLNVQNIMNSVSEGEGAKEPLVLSVGEKKIVLSMMMGPQPNCVGQGQPCGLLDPCCSPYVCYSSIPGVAIIQGYCR